MMQIHSHRAAHPVHVLIDTTQVPVQKAGVGVYAKGLLDALLQLQDGARYFVLRQDDDPDFLYPGLSNIQSLSVSSGLFRRLPARAVMEQTYLPALIRKHRIQVVHSLHYAFPLLHAPAASVVTVHDLIAYLLPNVLTWPKRHYLRAWLRMAAARAGDIIFVSESSRQDFLARFRRDRTHVVPLGVSESFRADIPHSAVAAVRQHYGIHGKYALYIGTLEPRKNLPRLLEAFARLRQETDCRQLVIAGSKGWHYREIFETVTRLKLEREVIFTGFVSEEEKRALLRDTSVFAYPSMYEGFGLPVLEALACGTPTITSNRSSLPEVAGAAALLVDPGDSQQLFDAMRRIVTDNALVAELRRRSLAQAARFSWTTAARRTAEIYRDAAQRRQHRRGG